MSETRVLRAPAEVRHAAELALLAAHDRDPRPPGWRLSPRAVRTFIAGTDGRPLADGAPPIARKFYGDDVLVERAIIGLAGDRAVMLVGEPGTAKSLLSELLAAAISGTSTLTVQGTAATTEDHVRYSWNYALLLAEGPTPRALVPSPLHTGMRGGLVVRFEEITRCPPEVQDTLVSTLSEKLMTVPELSGEAGLLFARPGFNVIATANLRDRGVHEMSSALKRRFNFETVHPIADLQAEVELVEREAGRALAESGAAVQVERDVVTLLVTVFQELRTGRTREGAPIERPSAVLSTAEAVSVATAAGLDAFYFGERRLTAERLGRHLAGAVRKDDEADVARLRHYFGTVVRERGRDGGPWAELHAARTWLR